MDSISNKNFGIVIAYILPGTIALVGSSFQFEVLNNWIFGSLGRNQPNVAGFLFSSLFALLIGLFCSTVRWLVVDTIHHKTGASKTNWNFLNLQSHIQAYSLLEENHYRYYQFYANSLIAWIWGFWCWRLAEIESWLTWHDAGFVIVGIVLFLGSRDTLRKYYKRVDYLLAQAGEESSQS